MIAFLLLLPLILGLVLVVAAAGLARWFVNSNPQQLAKTLRSGGSLALVLLGVVLLLRGQVMLGGSLVMAGLGRMSAGQAGHGGFGSAGPFGGFGHHGKRAQPKPGQSSTVRTTRLEATLDHDSGEMDVRVLAGRHQGRTFADMNEAEVVDFWRECGGDEESRLVVEAYLDRRCPEWREDADRHGNGGTGGARGAAGGGAMSVDEAYEVLGLQAGASEAEIRASHRRLMKQMHPDQGGSTFFAAKLNEAKDVLLGKR